MPNLLVYIPLYVCTGILYAVGMAVFATLTRYRRYGIDKVHEAIEDLKGSGVGFDSSTFVTNLIFWPVCLPSNFAAVTKFIDERCEE